MIPQGRLSTRPVIGELIGARASGLLTPTFDLSDGGIALNDGTEGLLYQTWSCTAKPDGIYIKADNATEQKVIDIPNVSECSLCFDANMDYLIAYTANGESVIDWFSGSAGGRVQTSIDGSNLKLIFDEPRTGVESPGEALLFYVREGELFCRRQTNRFIDEYSLGGSIESEGQLYEIEQLLRVAHANNFRLHFECKYRLPE